MAETILSLKDAALTLDGNAGRVEILKGITLDVARGETSRRRHPGAGSNPSTRMTFDCAIERAERSRSGSPRDRDMSGRRVHARAFCDFATATGTTLASERRKRR